MRGNGILRYQIVANGGLNEHGEAIPSQVGWSKAIPCLIRTNNDNRKGTYEDGEYRQSSYSVMIECMEFPYSRIMLERLGAPLGEFPVISAERFPNVGRTVITV